MESTMMKLPTAHVRALLDQPYHAGRMYDDLDSIDSDMRELVEGLGECLAVLTDSVVGTINHDDPDWYGALDRAVEKARALLSKHKD
jgi:hypothetical protein